MSEHHIGRRPRVRDLVAAACAVSIGVGIGLSVNLGSVAFAQQRDASGGRPPDPVRTGTAILAGVVTTDAASDTPVQRAIITLVASEGGDARSTVSDESGRFAFSGLPAGRFTLTAQKPAHLKNHYGATRPGRPGTSIALGDGQQLTGVRMTLPRGGVVTGTLRLATGEPLRDTQVLAIPAAQAEAGGRVIGPAEFLSDDRGVYRIYGLAPGDYLIGALPAVGRGEVEVRTRSYDDIVRELTQLAGRPALPAGAEPASEPEPEFVGYAPTYYPGTPVAAAATRVTVGLGEVRDGIDIPITMFRMSSISGTVTGTDGQPARAVQISTEAIGPPLPLGGSLSIRNNRPDAQGRFTITNVPPGSYRVSAAGGGVTLNPDGSLRSVQSAGQTDWAVAYVEVSGDNVEGVSLRLQPGMTFSGTLAAAAGSGDAPESWQGARITIQPVGSSGMPVMLNGSMISGAAIRSAAVGENGAFEVTGIQPGNYEVQLRLPATVGDGWAVRSITTGSGDLRDAPLTFEGGSIGNVTIALSDQRTTVTGTLTSADGTPAPEYYVVVFAADPGLWHATSPRVQAVRPGADGTFTAMDLPAGNYRIAALTDVEDDEWRTPAFLEQLLPASVPIVVRDGETTRQDIRIR